MVSFFLIGDIVRSGVSAYRKYQSQMRDNPLKPEIEKLRKERGKWISAIDLIGRELPCIGEPLYKLKEDAMNHLSPIEGVALPCARGNPFIPNKVYFYTDPSKITHISPTGGSYLIDKIYPQPQKAVSCIEKAIDEYVCEAEDIGHILDFEEKRTGIISKLVFSRKKIKSPYEPGLNYNFIQQELFQTVNQMQEIEHDYYLKLAELEHKRNIKIAKIGVAAAATFVAGAFITSKLKKVGALKTIVQVSK